MSELDQAPTLLARVLDGMIRKAIREELTLRESEPRRAGTIQQSSEWMTGEMVAARLGISEVTLYSWRASTKVPPYSKIGQLIRYKTAYADAWVEERLIRSFRARPSAHARRYVGHDRPWWTLALLAQIAAPMDSSDA